MAGRMSINWLLNEDEESTNTANHNGQQDQYDIQHYQDPELRRPHANSDPIPNSNAMIYKLNQQSQHPHYTQSNVKQRRTSSASSRTGSVSRSTQPRAPRPKYSVEEDHFIWYQRIDLDKDWKEVSHAFNEHFFDRHRDGESGLQCRFYRTLSAAGIPNIRSLKNSSDKERIAQYGLVKLTRHRYKWMEPRHLAA
jgi:hypothetical protein